MCGRYATTRSSVDLSALFEASDDVEGLEPDYNVAPTDPVPIVRAQPEPVFGGGEHGPVNRVRNSAEGRRLSTARWGLLPHWAKDARAGAKMINARAETVATSNAFAASFAKRRCLVPADGWYEWVKFSAGAKQAYYMTPLDGQICAFAGIWATWGADKLLTCSVVTIPAINDLTLIHDRMPLLLPPDRWAAWLEGPASDELLTPTPPELVANLELRPVGAAVGDVRNDGPGLIARVNAPPLGGMPESPVDLTLF